MRRPRRRAGYARASKPSRNPGTKNRTEQEHEDTYLRPLQARGEVLAWWYESITFRLAFDTRYTPDFVVLMADGSLVVHEIKGGLIRDDAAVKLKTAATLYPLRFELHQKLPKKHGGGWKRTEVQSDAWTEAAA